MSLLTRILAGVTAAFQLLVGLLSILAPTAAGAVFRVEMVASPFQLALVRMFGGLLAGAGIVAALFMVAPDQPRGVRRAYATALLLNVLVDCVVIGAGELGAGQLLGGMVPQLALAAALFAGPRVDRAD